MADVLSAQHSPALRVAGRRLSMTRPKPHHATGTTSPICTNPSPTTDYPRPAAQGPNAGTDANNQDQNETHSPPHHEEEPPRKEKKNKHTHGGYDHGRLKESLYGKMDATMPSKDHLQAKHGFGAGGRIAQPMGRTLTV